jgi:hypothetical protein
MKRALGLLVGLAACDGPSETISDDVDGGQVVDASPIDVVPDEVDAGADAGCVDPGEQLGAWTTAYQQEVVSKLSGEDEIAAGVTLTDRASLGARSQTRDYLLAELIAHGLPGELDSYESGDNVLAVLPGPPDAPVVILGAHYDGVPGAPAAADNATGVALVLSAARHFAAGTCRDRTLIFIFFDQEELGLVGAKSFAGRVEASFGEVHAMHNFDMISFDGDQDRVIELWSPTAFLAAEYAAAAEEIGLGGVKSFTFGSSDHQAFLAKGLPAVGVSEEFVGGDSTAHYHTPDDSFDKIDFAFLLDATRLAVTVVARQAGPARE